MVCPRHPAIRPFIRDNFICLVRSRDHDRTVLSMYRRAVQPRPPQRGAYRVGSRILQTGHVLTR